MPIPTPAPGLVIRYSYLWNSEYLAGREEGTKDRPAAIIAMITTNADGQLRALVLPITHSAPQKGTAAIEIPMTVRRAIGLDSDRSWIVLAEWNEFVWPGPDLRPVPNDTGGNMAYGYLPREFFVRVRDEFVATVEVGRANRIARTE